LLRYHVALAEKEI